MTENKTIKEYAEDIRRVGQSPSALANIQVELATLYAFRAEEMKKVRLTKAAFWKFKEFENDGETKREKPLSDTALEMRWNLTDSGQKEIVLKYDLDSLEKLLSALKSTIVAQSVESRIV